MSSSVQQEAMTEISSDDQAHNYIGLCLSDYTDTQSGLRRKPRKHVPQRASQNLPFTSVLLSCKYTGHSKPSRDLKTSWPDWPRGQNLGLALGL